jgi:hypothetical protein
MALDYGVRTLGDLEPPTLLASREHEARMEVASALRVPFDEVFIETSRRATDTVLRARWIPPL